MSLPTLMSCDSVMSWHCSAVPCLTRLLGVQKEKKVKKSPFSAHALLLSVQTTQQEGRINQMAFPAASPEPFGVERCIYVAFPFHKHPIP